VNVLRHTDTDGIRKAKIANKNITELCNYMEQSSSQEEEEEEEEEPVPEAPSLGIKRQGREDHSPPSSSVVKNACSCTSTPQSVSRAWCLVKPKDNSIFTQQPISLRSI
jgi:hypothetical protein